MPPLSTLLRTFILTVADYFRFSVLLLLLQYISEANIVLLLHYNHLKTLVTSYVVDFDYYYKTHSNHFSPTVYMHFGHLKMADLQAHNASHRFCTHFELVIWDILRYEYFYFQYFKYILMPILLYFYSSTFSIPYFYF